MVGGLFDRLLLFLVQTFLFHVQQSNQIGPQSILFAGQLFVALQLFHSLFGRLLTGYFRFDFGIEFGSVSQKYRKTINRPDRITHTGTLT